ncbi:MAG: hypothetical protein ACLUE1_01370 [Adlercreutzia equolifaciens]
MDAALMEVVLNDQAVAAVADPSVACALALPAEDVASSVAAPARAREVGWAQRAANVLFGAPSARRACGGTETSFTPKVLRNEKWRRRRETGSVFAVDRKGGAGEGGLPRIWVSGRRPTERARSSPLPLRRDRGGCGAPWAGGGLFQRALAAGENIGAAASTAAARCSSACGGPGQRRRPLPSRRHLRGRSVRGRTGTAWPIARRSRWTPLRRAPTALLLQPIMVTVSAGVGRSGGRGSGMRFLGGSGFRCTGGLRFEAGASTRIVRARARRLRLARAFELGRGCEQDFRRAHLVPAGRRGLGAA